MAIDEEVPDRAKSAPKAAPAPGARPAQPVTTAQSMSDAPNGKLQYMSTTERLRRLNEALSREVPLDTPARRNLPTLTDRMTD